jgi:hypothetical protein
MSHVLSEQVKQQVIALGRLGWSLRRLYTEFSDTWTNFQLAKNNRSKSVCTLFQRKRLSNQTVWLVIFGLTGPICASALKSFHLLELRPRGHHDWPVKPTIRPETPDVLGPKDR